MRKKAPLTPSSSRRRRTGRSPGEGILGGGDAVVPPSSSGLAQELKYFAGSAGATVDLQPLRGMADKQGYLGANFGVSSQQRSAHTPCPTQGSSFFQTQTTSPTTPHLPLFAEVDCTWTPTIVSEIQLHQLPKRGNCTIRRAAAKLAANSHCFWHGRVPKSPTPSTSRSARRR